MDYQAFTDQELNRLREIVGSERVATGPSILDLHGKDESFHPRRNPEAVVWPHSPGEIRQILAMADERRIPVTPWGAGTSLEGNPIPVCGGIVLDLQQMNRTVELSVEDLQICVEPGVIYKEMNRSLSRYGLFFPPDPGAAASIGGMVANNASGVRTIKYGSTKDYVLTMEIVLPTGEIVRVGRNAMKSSSGYDLCRLFVGSEGTLGVITQVTLRLVGLPAEFMAAIVQFDSVRAATNTVFQIMRSGLSPAALELLDTPVVQLVNQYRGLSLEEKPTLFIEFHGTSTAGLKEEQQVLKEICEENRSIRIESGIGREERNRLWEARYDVHDAIKVANPGLSPLVIDVAVPISKYPDIVERSQKIVAQKGVKGYAFGHAGSGNLHLEILGIPEREAEWRRVEEAGEEIVNYALDSRGTATGEHGIGIGKRKFMQKEHGTSVDLMKRIKNLLDPHGIMNPGKVFP